jgi:hypothetical protein
VVDTSSAFEREETTMVTRTLLMTTAVLSLAASAALAAGLTEQLQATRMTVVRVDREAGKFLCAEHRRWTTVSDLGAAQPGDIVKLNGRAGQRPRVTVLRRAADEIASPEL